MVGYKKELYQNEKMLVTEVGSFNSNDLHYGDNLSPLTVTYVVLQRRVLY